MVDVTQADREALEPCPFCQNPLTIKRGCNPVAKCETDGCWLAERKISMPIDDPRQVATWNTRLASTAALQAERDALAARVEALEGFVENLARPNNTYETWIEAVQPLITRFTVASAFDMQAVHNGQGADAIAKLMSYMARKLDWAQDAARKALGEVG